MRTIVLVAIALAAMSLIGSFAGAGSWCGTYKLGSTSCGYASSEECLATVRALADFANRIHSPGRPMGPPPGAGISLTRQGANGAAISAMG
jgi:hypothetical protein